MGMVIRLLSITRVMLAANLLSRMVHSMSSVHHSCHHLTGAFQVTIRMEDTQACRMTRLILTSIFTNTTIMDSIRTGGTHTGVMIMMSSGMSRSE